MKKFQKFSDFHFFQFWSGNDSPNSLIFLRENNTFQPRGQLSAPKPKKCLFPCIFMKIAEMSRKVTFGAKCAPCAPLGRNVYKTNWDSNDFAACVFRNQPKIMKLQIFAGNYEK